MAERHQPNTATQAAVAMKLHVFEQDNTDFLLNEGLPLLSTFRLIESPQVRRAIYEIVKRAAGTANVRS